MRIYEGVEGSPAIQVWGYKTTEVWFPEGFLNPCKANDVKYKTHMNNDYYRSNNNNQVWQRTNVQHNLSFIFSLSL